MIIALIAVQKWTEKGKTMELNREQVIKALECCAKGCCGDCPRSPFSLGCCRKTMLDALSLIKELTEENKKLTEHNAQILQFGEEWEALARKFEAENKKLAEENERLKADAIVFENALEIALDSQKQDRADTVRKMQMALWAHLSPYSIYTTTEVGVLIDQIAKEMLEGNDGT